MSALDRSVQPTSGALRDFSGGDEPLPDMGRYDIATDWDGAPALVPPADPARMPDRPLGRLATAPGVTERGR